MKKFLCLILSVACLLMTATLFSCGGYPKPASIVYTTEILINQEPFPTNLVLPTTCRFAACKHAARHISRAV